MKGQKTIDLLKFDSHYGSDLQQRYEHKEVTTSLQEKKVIETTHSYLEEEAKPACDSKKGSIQEKDDGAEK